MVIAFGSELRGQDIQKLANFRCNFNRSKTDLSRRLREFARRQRDGTLSRPVAGIRAGHRTKTVQEEWGKLPSEKGLTLPEMVDAAKAGKLKALYVVGSNPVGRLWHRSFCVLEEFRGSAGYVPHRNCEHRRRGIASGERV